MDVRILTHFVLTTINVALDAFVFEDWSFLLVGTFALRISILPSIYNRYCYSNGGEEKEKRSNYAAFVEKCMCVSYALPCFFWCDKIPFTWESTLWSVHTDLVLLIWIWYYGTASTAVAAPSSSSSSSTYQHALQTPPPPQQLQLQHMITTIHEMYASYYFAAAFWKFNTHFLDYQASCATIFLVQQASQYWSVLLGTTTLVGIVRRMVPWAPIATLLVESSMGIGLILGRIFANNDRSYLRIGLYSIVYFHLAVCLTPEPNNISMFAVQCAARLVLLMDPTALSIVITEIMKKWWKGILIVASLATAYGVKQQWTPLNFGFLAYAFSFVILHWTMIVEYKNEGKKNAKRITTGSMNGFRSRPLSPVKNRQQQEHGVSTESTHRPRWMYAATSLAVFYSFGTIVLGTMEEASCNMFANLKIHGGSNHLLLPTGLLFIWFRDAGDQHPYGGGEIRLESTTSEWLPTIYPNDLTHILQPSANVSKLLDLVLEVPAPYFFNSGSNRVLGQRERGWVPPPPDPTLIQYTVPALEWKRLLSEAIQKDATFTVTYSHLPGSNGDEEWRANAYERRVELSVKNGKIDKCRETVANGKRQSCSETSLPYQLNSVPWWAHKLGLYHGYPILYDPDKKTVRRSIQCFGP